MLLLGEAGLELRVFYVPQQFSLGNARCITGLAPLMSELHFQFLPLLPGLRNKLLNHIISQSS